MFTSDVGIFIEDKSDFQYDKITSSLEDFYHQVNLLSNNTVYSTEQFFTPFFVFISTFSQIVLHKFLRKNLHYKYHLK